MMRFQFVLAIFTLIAFSACQNDTSVDTAQKTSKKAAAMSEKAGDDMKKEVKQMAEADQGGSTSPKLREFYVEEDKSKVEPTKAAAKSSSAEKADTPADKDPAKQKSKPASKKSPKLSFTNNSHAFGIIKPGEVIEHKFEFTNTGSADLVITDAKATCGCTQPSFPFVPIPPGEKGYIGVKYDSTGKLGTQKPTVTLTTNAYPKTQKVYLEGIVISELSKN